MKRYKLVLAVATIGITSTLAMAQSRAGETAAPQTTAPNQARASSELQWLQEESVAITSDRSPRRTETVPSNITVITAEQIERSGAKHVPELLRFYAGVEVIDFFDNGRQARVDVRGFGINADSSTLVLVDGRRINGVTLFNTDWTTIPIDRIARIEIMRGGNSVLYGNQAVGGVINIITKRGTVEKELIGGVDAGGNGYVKPYADYSGTSLLLDGVLAYNVSAGHTHSDGYRDNSDYRMSTGGLALNFEKGRFIFDLTAATKDDRYGLPGGRTLTEPRRSATTPNDVADTRDSYVHFVPGYRLSERDRVVAAVDYRPTRQFNKFEWGSIKDDIDQHGVSPQYIGEHQFRGVKNKLVTGFDYLKSDLYRNTDSAFGASIDDNTMTSKAWYVHDAVSVHEDTVHFDLGYRKERFDYDLRQMKVSRNIDVHALRFGATWNYRGKNKLFAGYDRSYRVQLLDETGPFGEEILRPQISHQYQTGIAHHLSSSSDVQVTYFLIDTDDEILFDPGKGLFGANTNHPDTRRQGVDVELKAGFNERVNGFLGYTYLNAKTQEGLYQGKRLPLSTPHKGAAGFNVSPVQNWWLGANYHWIEGKVLDSDFLNGGGWKDSWQVVDLVTSYEHKDYSITAAIKNLLGERYAEYGLSLPAYNILSIWPNQTRTLFVGVKFHHAF